MKYIMQKIRVAINVVIIVSCLSIALGEHLNFIHYYRLRGLVDVSMRRTYNTIFRAMQGGVDLPQQFTSSDLAVRMGETDKQWIDANLVDHDGKFYWISRDDAVKAPNAQYHIATYDIDNDIVLMYSIEQDRNARSVGQVQNSPVSLDVYQKLQYPLWRQIVFVSLAVVLSVLLLINRKLDVFRVPSTMPS